MQSRMQVRFRLHFVSRVKEIDEESLSLHIKYVLSGINSNVS